MGEYVDVNGVRTHYDDHGTGEPLLLLHGGLCTNDTWRAQIPALAGAFRVLAPERRGHGRTADVEGPLSYETMTQDTISFVDTVIGGPVHVVGWSDGGVVALLLALARPDLVRRLVLIGAGYDVAGNVPGAIEADPDNEDLAMLRGMYAASSPDGADHWPVVVGKVGEMWGRGPHIPADALGRIAARTLVLVGDDDAVTLEHTIELYRALPDAELAVVPGASHAVCVEKPDLVNRLLLDFLQLEPAPTFLPVRRRSVDA